MKRLRPWMAGWWMLVGAALPVPVFAQQALVDAAINRAIETFETALPQLGADAFGVDSATYREALEFQRFASDHWGGTVRVAIATGGATDGSCARFAAYTRLPPESGLVRLVLCPQFFTQGADALRELTILHEMVHVVAGSSECRAMAFAARVQQAAHGSYLPVDGYWQASGCGGSGFTLP